MTDAHKYMLYTMEANGQVIRTHRARVIGPPELADYTLRETLLGWPETEVYWRILGDFSRVGIAPLSQAAQEAMLHYGGFTSIS